MKVKVVEIAQQALYEAIAICKPGMGFNRVGQVIEKVCRSAGMHVC